LALGFCALLLAVALAFPLYDTPFGRAPTRTCSECSDEGGALARCSRRGGRRRRRSRRSRAPRSREPCASYDPQRQPFFGDTHVHTAFSFDAWGQGTLAGPRDAYRFARGEEIGMQPYGPDGRAQAQIRCAARSTFAVVTDHSDLLGETQICQNPALPGYDSLVCRVVRRFPKLGYTLVNGATYSSEHPDALFVLRQGRRELPRRRARPVARDPGRRRDLLRPQRRVPLHHVRRLRMDRHARGDNLHRNVIFRNTTAQAYPTTYIETPTPEGLWRALETECLAAGNGCDVLAIPHNSNVSNGRMFTATRSGRRAAHGRRRARARALETLAEVTQHKGDSECRAGAEDELCSYEKLAMPRMQDMASASRAQPLPPQHLSCARRCAWVSSCSRSSGEPVQARADRIHRHATSPRRGGRRGRVPRPARAR
jgi:hypothetical protein